MLSPGSMSKGHCRQPDSPSNAREGRLRCPQWTACRTTVKDILWVEGWPVSYESYAVEDRECIADAPAVGQLRRSGVIFVGQTTYPEFGWEAVTDSPRRGITRNPWDATKTPGGSSGGAAVAAGR
ncbi:hypothetical protein J1C56_08080 [Aminobacter anthyllidis]|uniref:Amidase domain-containing protein n=2 Tax=Aminobacter anthyllidis TaxID=1035067 RepID=A0A9X1D388_9HYPH|nr:hypothetical protein [Aminobacter anthyllidis]